jgi:hypothetical protein
MFRRSLRLALIIRLASCPGAGGATLEAIRRDYIPGPESGGTTAGAGAFRDGGQRDQEGAMSNLSQRPSSQKLPPAVRHEASNFTLAVVMAGIAAFFIAGIASVFIYAKDTSPMQHASMQKPATTATAPAETTGSGGDK